MTKSVSELAVRMLAGPHENPDNDLSVHLAFINRKIVESLGVPAEMLGSGSSSSKWIAQNAFEYYRRQMIEAYEVECALLKDR